MDCRRWESSDGSTARRARYAWVGSTGVFVAFGLLSCVGLAEAASQPHKLLGCWTQTSPYSRDQIPEDKSEWGSRIWCFRARGIIETINTACGKGRDGKKGACDGWDGEYHYRWRGPKVELENFTYDDKGEGEKRIWHRCLPAFSKDRFVLTGCGFSQEPFVRDKDPHRTE